MEVQKIKEVKPIFLPQNEYLENKGRKISEKEAEEKLNKIQNKLIKAQKSLNKRPYSEKRQSKLNRLKQQEELLVSFIDGLGQLTASSNTYTFWVEIIQQTLTRLIKMKVEC